MENNTLPFCSDLFKLIVEQTDPTLYELANLQYVSKQFENYTNILIVQYVVTHMGVQNNYIHRISRSIIINQNEHLYTKWRRNFSIFKDPGLLQSYYGNLFLKMTNDVCLRDNSFVINDEATAKYLICYLYHAICVNTDISIINKYTQIVIDNINKESDEGKKRYIKHYISQIKYRIEYKEDDIYNEWYDRFISKIVDKDGYDI